jgi:hypothetical protein
MMWQRNGNLLILDRKRDEAPTTLRLGTLEGKWRLMSWRCGLCFRVNNRGHCERLGLRENRGVQMGLKGLEMRRRQGEEGCRWGVAFW